MSFFAGASNIKIVGGEFNDIKGNYTVFDHSRHETNIDSSNIYNNKIIDSYNDNSKRISGRIPRSRLLRDVEGGDDKLRTPPISADDQGEEEDHTGPPHHPQSISPQLSSAGGRVTNFNAFNMENNQINNVFNDNSRTHYYGGGPPPNQRRGVGRRSMHEGEKDFQSNNGSFGSGQKKVAAQGPFQAAFPQHTMGTGMGSGSSMSVHNPMIQDMTPEMRRNFSKLMKYTLAQTESITPENNNENDSDDAESASSHSVRTENSESITAGVDRLSIKDGHLSPPSQAPLLSRNKSDPQIAQPTTSRASRQIGSSSPSSLSPYNNSLQSHSNPSLAPHMKEQGMVNFLAPPAAVQQLNNDPNKHRAASTSGFNFPPSSGGGPIFRTINGDYVKHDTTIHRTNINSFNREDNTIQGSFNDNSVVVVESSKKKKKRKVKNTAPIDNSPVDSSEEQEKEDVVEITIQSDDSAVDSSEKERKGKQVETTIQSDNPVVDFSEKQKKGKKILGLFGKK